MCFRITASSERFPTRGSGRRGITIIEILVASVIMGILSSMAFPIYGIIQQRERERRLRITLDNVRAAISGSGQYEEGRIQTIGYESYLMVEMKRAEQTLKVSYPKMKPNFFGQTISHNATNKTGMMSPLDPVYLVNKKGDPFVVRIPTGMAEPDYPASVTVTINNRFIRHIPPHPFQGVYPGAHFQVKAATWSAIAIDDGWFVWPPEDAVRLGLPGWVGAGTNGRQATGVVDIRSRGAGLSISGVTTDEF